MNSNLIRINGKVFRKNRYGKNCCIECYFFIGQGNCPDRTNICKWGNYSLQLVSPIIEFLEELTKR
jgi:hypothetical protein